jgi:hypothetical protein
MNRKPICSPCKKGRHEDCIAQGKCYCLHSHHNFGGSTSMNRLLADFGVEPMHKARLIMRAMPPVHGVRRTLIMGVVVGDFCPDGVDRKVAADLKIKVTAAERAKRRKDGFVTDGIAHGSLMLDEIMRDTVYWEPEKDLPPVDTYEPKKKRKS